MIDIDEARDGQGRPPHPPAVAGSDAVTAPVPVSPGSMAEMVATFGHLATGDEPPTLPFRAAWVPTVHDEDDR